MNKGSVKVVFIRQWRAYPDGFTERLYGEGEECEVPNSLAESWIDAKICRPASSTLVIEEEMKTKPLPLDARATKPKPKRTRKKIEK